MRAASAAAIAAAALVAALAMPAVQSRAAGGSDTGAPGAAERRSEDPASVAAEHYRAGLRSRDAAWRHEARAAAASSPEARASHEARAREAYDEAAEHQRRAIVAVPDMHQAHASLGYALRRLGRHTEAVASYDRALALDPDYGEAIEYRAEAMLALGQLDEVRAAHASLRSQPELAAQLLEAVERWVDDQRPEPGAATPSDVEALARWAADRRTAKAPGAERADPSPP